MESANWRVIAEMVGVSAIVGSLVFVGLQIRQTQEIALATQFQNRAEAALVVGD